MAEPFSFVAGVCEVGMQIFEAGAKIKHLYEQLENAPSSLASTIEMIQLHASDFAPVGATPTGAGTNATPESAIFLAGASGHFRKVLRDLQEIAEELDAHMQKAQGRKIKRHLAALKFVLKTDVLARHESRLARAGQLLMQAKMTYMMTLIQQMQFGICVERSIITASKQPATLPPLPATPASAGTHNIGTAASTRKPGRCVSTCWTWPSGESYQFGIPQLTGTVEIQIIKGNVKPSHEARSSGPSNCSRCPDESQLRLRIKLPTWMRNMVIENLISRSTSGWTHHIRVHNMVQWEPYRQALQMIDTVKDVSELHQFFNTGVMGPRDRNPYGLGLLSNAIVRNRWDVATFLLDHGAEQDTPFVITDSTQRKSSYFYRDIVSPFTFGRDELKVVFRHPSEKAEDQCFEFHRSKAFDQIKDLSLPEEDFWLHAIDTIRLGMLRCSIVAVFTSDPLSIFTGEPFKKRVADILHNSVMTPNKESEACALITCMILSYSTMWYYPPGVFASFRSLFRRLISKIPPNYLGNGKLGLFASLAVTPHPSVENPLLPAEWPEPSEVVPAGHRWTRTVWLDRLIRCYLSDLHLGGVDLGHYASTIGLRTILGADREFRALTDGETRGKATSRTIVGITGGPGPDEWKVWWSEHTDCLVGIFWSFVEQEYSDGRQEEQVGLRSIPDLPGGWVD